MSFGQKLAGKRCTFLHNISELAIGGCDSANESSQYRRYRYRYYRQCSIAATDSDSFSASQNSDFKLFRDFSLHEYNTVGSPLKSTSSGHFKHWFKGFPWVSAGPKYFKIVGQM